MKIIAFFAHPDDETMLCGGTVALLASLGVRVHYLCATRGEGGENGEPPLCSREKLGAVREQEMRCAVQALGGASLTFLGYIDPNVDPDGNLFAYTDDMATLLRRLAEAAHQVQADVVLTHGSNGEYGHPAHILTHQAARLAFAPTEWDTSRGVPPSLYTIQANFAQHPRPRLANKDDPAQLVLDITPVLPQKEAAALCHRTQHALFVRRPSREAGRPLTVPEVLLRLESLHRVYPPEQAGAGDPLMELLLPYQWNHSASVEQQPPPQPR